MFQETSRETSINNQQFTHNSQRSNVADKIHYTLSWRSAVAVLLRSSHNGHWRRKFGKKRAREPPSIVDDMIFDEDGVSAEEAETVSGSESDSSPELWAVVRSGVIFMFCRLQAYLFAFGPSQRHRGITGLQCAFGHPREGCKIMSKDDYSTCQREESPRPKRRGCRISIGRSYCQEIY